MATCPFQSVEEYIGSFGPEVQEKLRRLRGIILETVPEAAEKLAWGAPTYYLNGYLLQFAVNQRDIGFYTTPATIAAWQEELKGYRTNSKNTTKFPLSEELPEELIKKMIRFRVEEKLSEKKT